MGPNPTLVRKGDRPDADSPHYRSYDWRYQAAIHDYHPENDPFATPGQALPPDWKKFWQQCQHGSWFFLPWHRMYLFYFKQIVTATIAQLGGPPDWALPYWNYSDPENANAARLPPAFIAQTMPDDTPNPLRVEERDEGNDGNPIGDLNDVDITNCLGEPVFASQARGGDPGFGPNFSTGEEAPGASKLRRTATCTWRWAAGWRVSTRQP